MPLQISRCFHKYSINYQCGCVLLKTAHLPFIVLEGLNYVLSFSFSLS
jgi:hypothetical protein